MPIYDLKCNSCNIQFEELLRMSAPLPKCPKCGNTTEKMISTPGMIEFKGKDYYKSGKFIK